MSDPHGIMVIPPKERNVMFDNVINEDAIAKLTDEQADALLAILEKAGY
jgi:hypothetical protein